jgi:hypothetical protein
MDVDFKAQLLKQLGFLQRSCETYDQGHSDEAIRIAVSIRILIHDTPKSTSLLRHLNALNIQLSSTVPNVDRSKAILQSSMGRIRITSAETTWAAYTDQDAIEAQLSVSDWWNQIVFTMGAVQATRKALVLAAANKDGGAHVDSALAPEYETLMTTGERGFFLYSPTSEMHNFQPIMDAHLVYIRQMGFELLNSPELLALTAET